jgi:hypothetical protein
MGSASRHYVRVGNRIMKPQRQRNHKLAKWLKNAGWRIDMTSMENMFATFHAHNHYFTIHWNPQDKVFELCDPLANVTTADHHEAIVLLWAVDCGTKALIERAPDSRRIPIVPAR